MKTKLAILILFLAAFKLNGGKIFAIQKRQSGEKITSITYDDRTIDGYFVSYSDLETGRDLVITTK